MHSYFVEVENCANVSQWALYIVSSIECIALVGFGVPKTHITSDESSVKSKTALG